MAHLGLCIVYKNWNYGSILQSYATLLKLQELGIRYEIIRYEKKKNFSFYIKSLPRLLNKDLRYSKLRTLRRKIGKKTHPEFATNDRIRSQVFQNFVDNYFDGFTETLHSYEDLKKKAQDFDAVLVGSDQLWLPSGLETNFFNLMFVPTDVRKISYSSSFGVSNIPTYQNKKTIDYLKRIEYISVREYSGKKIIKSLIDRDVPVILDPTLNITKECWDKHIPLVRQIDEEYIFCYFLGNSPEYRKEAEKLSIETGLKIVTLRHMDEFVLKDENFGNFAPYDVGPVEFVNLIRNAMYVCTDSFHGSVFSIMYHKQFISFNRYGNKSKNSRNSRLDSLFYQLGIERRFKYNIITEIKDPINYLEVEKRLSDIRKNSITYLEEALKGI